MTEILAQKWIEIDLDAIENNLCAIRSRLQEGVTLIAVLKANAYGHGAVELARVLHANGVTYFAVSFVEEALALRRNGVDKPILVFSPAFSPQMLREAVENDLRLTIASRHDWSSLLSILPDVTKKPQIHIKVDTGLGRFGLLPEEAEKLIVEIEAEKSVVLEGLYTHMAYAANASSTEQQFASFLQLVKAVEARGINIPLKHCANSAVLLKYPRMHMDGVRVGTLLSGQHPVGTFPNPLSLLDPYQFKARLLSVRTLPRGASLGYYRTYRLKHEAQIGVLPVGFYDGLALEVGNRPAGLIDLIKMLARIVLGYCNVPRFTPQVLYQGHPYPIRGKVFMQLALVEFPADVSVQVGDVVEVPVRKTLASPETLRVYVRQGKVASLVEGEVVCTYAS